MSKDSIKGSIDHAIELLTAASAKFATENEAAIKILQQAEESTQTKCPQWQCETKQGWTAYDKDVSDMLEQAHKRGDVVVFTVNDMPYTVDMSELVKRQKRCIPPFTERSMRRTMVTKFAPESTHVEAMIQALQQAAEQQARRNDELIADLRDRADAMTSLESFTWECEANGKWSRYSSDINKALEAGYKVSLMYIVVELSLKLSFMVTGVCVTSCCTYKLSSPYTHTHVLKQLPLYAYHAAIIVRYIVLYEQIWEAAAAQYNAMPLTCHQSLFKEQECPTWLTLAAWCNAELPLQVVQIAIQSAVFAGSKLKK
jgi:WWE domain